MDEEGYAVRPKKSYAQSFGSGLTSAATFGFADELAALPISYATGQTYDDTLNRIRVSQKQEAADNPKTYMGGQVAGAVGTGVALAPLSATGRALQAGQGLGRVSLASGLDSALVGAASGAGEGTSAGDRLKRAGMGGAVGGLAGLLLPGAMTAAGTVAKPFYEGAKGLLNIGNQSRADRLIAESFARSGKSVPAVIGDLTQAGAEGQGMYTLADALGDAGQRRLSSVTRVPGPQRTKIVEALEGRQQGQGRRISTFLDEGFNTSQGTALKKTAADKAARSAEANLNYGQARQAAGAVDTSAAIQKLDDILTPGVTRTIGTGAGADDSVYGTLAKARSYLTDGNAQVSDFDRALRAKIEMDAILERGGPAAAKLRPARDALDDALAQSSAPYANARDTFRQQSKAIEAIDKGKQAAMRGRTEDTTSLFGGLGPDERAGFRAGYVDPLIADVQKAAATANKARPLINDATAVEFPAFAAPGRAPQLQRQIGREDTMFQTRHAAKGGSATAENLADNADTMDIGLLANIASGRWGAAAGQVGGALSRASSGLNETTRDLVGGALLQTDPVMVQELVKAAQKSGKDAVKARALLNMLLNQPAGRIGGQQQ
jgi:hypothetical protein